LHRGVEIVLAHGDYLVERREIDADATLNGQQVAFERGAGSKSNDRSAMAVAQCDDFGDFPCGLGEYHRIRRHWRVRGFILAMMQADRSGDREARAEAGG
jgi:hypothetical protein